MTELAVHPTAIPGLMLVDLPVHGDNRGWFKENWQRQKMVAAGLPDLAFIQNNISYNADAGTTRGIHAEPWDKYVAVATGTIFAAWVDLREGPDFGTVVTAELGPDCAALVPRGVGNSFQTLEDSTAYTYLVTDHWSASAQQQYTFVNAADPELGIRWPIPLERAQRSAKDLDHPPLQEVTPHAGGSAPDPGQHWPTGQCLGGTVHRKQRPVRGTHPHNVGHVSTWHLASTEPAGIPRGHQRHRIYSR